MVSEADARCARAVDAILDGMRVHHRLAIYATHGVAVWRFRWDLGVVYREAMEEARLGLRGRGIQ